MRAAGIAMAFAAGNTFAQCYTISRRSRRSLPAPSRSARRNLDDTIAVFSGVRSGDQRRLVPAKARPHGAGREAADLRARAETYTANFSGTSGSSPEVAGAIALLWSAIPGLRGDVSATEELLEQSAVPLKSELDCFPYLGSLVPNPIFGWGRLDVASAYARATARGAPEVAPEGARATRTVARD